MGEATRPGHPNQRLRHVASVPEEVLDDLETAFTRIDSSGTDDEPLVRLSSGKNRARRDDKKGSQGSPLLRLRVVSSSLQDVGSTVGDSVFRGRQRFRVTNCIHSPGIFTGHQSSFWIAAGHIHSSEFEEHGGS